jgi:3-hydroxyisobutyrate dehydrogenase-like beta-hydroxyacid dehydrogenase
MQKDLNLVMEAAQSSKVPLPATSLIQQLFRSLNTASEGDGTQALARVLERLSGDEITN